MNTESVKAELKQHCIAIGALLTKLHEEYPDEDLFRCSMTTDSDGYCTFNVIAIKDYLYHSIIHLTSFDMLNDKWDETKPYSGSLRREDAK